MSGFSPIKPPRPPRGTSGASTPSGLPRPPKRVRAAKINATTLQAYPEPHPMQGIDWRGKPLTEYVTAWVLMEKLGGKLGKDFLYQQILPASQVNISGKGFRSDFWILPRGRFGGPGPPYTRGIVLDPISLYTHGHTGEDRFRRGRLAQLGWLMIWLDDVELYINPTRVVRNALQGIDTSSIARSAR